MAEASSCVLRRATERAPTPDSNLPRTAGACFYTEPVPGQAENGLVGYFVIDTPKGAPHHCASCSLLLRVPVLPVTLLAGRRGPSISQILYRHSHPPSPPPTGTYYMDPEAVTYQAAPSSSDGNATLDWAIWPVAKVRGEPLCDYIVRTDTTGGESFWAIVASRGGCWPARTAAGLSMPRPEAGS